jgi:hypothetical protein
LKFDHPKKERRPVNLDGLTWCDRHAAVMTTEQGAERIDGSGREGERLRQQEDELSGSWEEGGSKLDKAGLQVPVLERRLSQNAGGLTSAAKRAVLSAAGEKVVS